MVICRGCSRLRGVSRATAGPQDRRRRDRRESPPHPHCSSARCRCQTVGRLDHRTRNFPPESPATAAQRSAEQRSNRCTSLTREARHIRKPCAPAAEFMSSAAPGSDAPQPDVRPLGQFSYCRHQLTNCFFCCFSMVDGLILLALWGQPHRRVSTHHRQVGYRL
jgi:hypothetical protein